MAVNIIDEFRTLLEQLDTLQKRADFFKNEAEHENPSDPRYLGNIRADNYKYEQSELKADNHFDKLREIIIKEYNNGNPTNTTTHSNTYKKQIEKVRFVFYLQNMYNINLFNFNKISNC